MLQSNFTRPANPELRWACKCFVALIIILGILPSCISLPQSSGPARKWAPAEYFYEPNVAGKCLLKNHVTQVTIDCDEPKMYEMVCISLDDSRRVQSDVINQCKAWK